MIFDFHTHIFPPEVIARRHDFAEKDPAFALIYGDSKARMVSAEGLVEGMDRDGVDKAVVCGFPWADRGLVRIANDYLLEAQQRYPGRIYAFYTPPLTGDDKVLGLADEALGKGMRGIGEVAFYISRMGRENWSYVGRLAGVARDRGVPFLLHENEPVGHSYPGKVEMQLKDIWDFAREQAELKLVLAHWGGGLFFYELMKSVRHSLGNLYYDTAASPFLYTPSVYRVAVEILGPGRVLFGSDCPLIRPSRYFREMQEAGLSSEDQSRILGRNALSLFGENES